jgi:hypothetical protein
MTIDAARLRMLPFQGKIRIGMVEVRHAVTTIMASGAFRSKILDVLDHKRAVFGHMTARTKLNISSELTVEYMTVRATDRRSIVIYLMPRQVEGCNRVIKALQAGI